MCHRQLSRFIEKLANPGTDDDVTGDGDRMREARSVEYRARLDVLLSNFALVRLEYTVQIACLSWSPPVVKLADTLRFVPPMLTATDVWVAMVARLNRRVGFGVDGEE
jgi:hypothetical protein